MQRRPAAVGQRIRQLEDQLGSPLFQRTTRKIVLTETGLAFLPLARAALAAVEEAMRVGRGERAATPIDLTIGTRQELGLSWILPMLPFLREEHPGLVSSDRDEHASQASEVAPLLAHCPGKLRQEPISSIFAS